MTVANEGTQPIDMTADILDTRDLIARIDHLEYWAGVGVEEGDNVGDSTYLDDNDREELAALVAYRDEYADDIPDWQYGETMVSDSYFEEYAQELANDIGAINSEASWPLTHIDWEAAAAALQNDYTETTLNGNVYWVR